MLGTLATGDAFKLSPALLVEDEVAAVDEVVFSAVFSTGDLRARFDRGMSTAAVMFDWPCATSCRQWATRQEACAHRTEPRTDAGKMPPQREMPFLHYPYRPLSLDSTERRPEYSLGAPSPTIAMSIARAHVIDAKVPKTPKANPESPIPARDFVSRPTAHMLDS